MPLVDGLVSDLCNNDSDCGDNSHCRPNDFGGLECGCTKFYIGNGTHCEPGPGKPLFFAHLRI